MIENKIKGIIIVHLFSACTKIIQSCPSNKRLDEDENYTEETYSQICKFK